MLKGIRAQQSRRAAQTDLGKLVEWMATTVAETLAYVLGESLLALAITTATELVHPKGCDCTNVCSETLLPR